MLRRLFRLPLFAVLVFQVALADSIPPRKLEREVRLSSANRSVPSLLHAVGSYIDTRGLGGNFFNGSGRSALWLNGKQESRLPTQMILVPLGDGQPYRPFGSRVGRSKSFADRVLVLFQSLPHGGKKPKH